MDKKKPVAKGTKGKSYIGDKRWSIYLLNVDSVFPFEKLINEVGFRRIDSEDLVLLLESFEHNGALGALFVWVVGVWVV